jgi:hypothetical protein
MMVGFRRRVSFAGYSTGFSFFLFLLLPPLHRRYCCRRMLLTHVDLIEKLLQYNSKSPIRLSRVRGGPSAACPVTARQSAWKQASHDSLHFASSGKDQSIECLIQANWNRVFLFITDERANGSRCSPLSGCEVTSVSRVYLRMLQSRMIVLLAGERASE